MPAATAQSFQYDDPQLPEFASGLSEYLQRCEQERDKRLRPQDKSQYVGLDKLHGGKELVQDPWITAGTPVNQVVPDGGRVKVTIVGAGFGGLQCAGKLIKSGLNVEDILMIDTAGGFGGTWYWQRYPGLACDTESYIYMPFLEDLDYMPTEKYASGDELRHYAEAVATHFGMQERAMLQTSTKAALWDGDAKEWVVDLLQKPKGGVEQSIKIRSDFLVVVSGIFTAARVPSVPNMEDFQGHCFHTSRWDYECTGGSSAEPKLTRLHDKRVGVVGTGATAVQAIPHLAKWAKELHVFQRTPSAVDHRGQKATDIRTWKSEIANKKGWQRERAVNFASCFTGLPAQPKIDLVDDEFSRATTYYVTPGGPNNVSFETIQQHLKDLNVEDFPRTERIQQRVSNVVQDPTTAEKLKAWYPTWCKRPTFSDEYLDSFNQPHVTLVNTGPDGIQSFSSAGLIVNETEYPVDVLIWSTGYEAPGAKSYADKCNMNIIGRNGLTMSKKFEQGFTTLHSVTSRNFPNLFFVGHVQAGVCPNFLFSSDVISDHIAYIINEATTRGDGAQTKIKAVVEAQQEAEEAHTNEVASMALVGAPLAECTPSYFNLEG